ncbi:MAG: bifunctional diaminohydroxyphosphoribosylaminopyrimidine deaminase/5-amino-6-(5-phosphoribosylamino)uracil reductase RibD [Acidobacteria bacterium]|nr:bifunctional diaminohydroxyphosphoribosylaminopyrimidine deaminase/5-amino-6-(5-phosphoribosylamino)uracil reductase RibD [Acidobacteriota bacterium]
MFSDMDRRFMKKALALAEKAIGLASPNPSVGCVIVRNGRIVGRGWHEYSLMDHAEVKALEMAGEFSRNATAYVTLEPCCHQGRTPPCVNRLIHSGIRRVVVAGIDPNPRVSGQGLKRLAASGIRVDVGLMSEEAAKIIEPFACHVATGTPLVIGKVGMSLDGKIGTGFPKGRGITSPEGRGFGHRLRLSADALLVGVGTVLADDPELTYRGTAPKARPLIRVILDSRLRTPYEARLFRTRPRAPILIFCGREAPEARRRKLEKNGAEIIRVSSSKSGLDLKAVLKELGKRKVLGLLVEGGSRVHWSFLSKQLVDLFYFIIAPVVLGGERSIPSVGGTGYRAIADSPRFKIRKSYPVGPDFVLETYPSYSKSILSPWLPSETGSSGARYPLPSSRRI